MTPMSHLYFLLFLVYGSVAFTFQPQPSRTDVVTVNFGPDMPQPRNNSSEEEIKDSNEGDKLKYILTNDLDFTSSVSPPQPPNPDEAAQMARFIVHYSSWGSLSHISHQPHIDGSPLARVYSISDGPIKSSSGVPYFYLTPKDPELQDMFRDPRVSLTLTLAQSPYCRMKAYDPEDPRCAQVILTGKLVVLKNSTSEWHQAQEALFSRHPVMKMWPKCHHWVCCRLEINRILVADNHGRNKYPTVEQYFQSQPNFCSHDDPLYQMAFF